MKNSLLIITMLILSGCSSGFAYKNLDWLAYWYIDDYIQLTENQKTIVDQKLMRWLLWHQQKELPRYIASLNDVIDDIENRQLSIEKLTHHEGKIKSHWQSLRTKVAPDLVVIASLLNEEQIADLFENLDEKNVELSEEIQKRLALGPKQYEKKAIKQYAKNLRRWIGKLSPEQETLIVEMYRQFEPSDIAWLAYKRRYQAELKTLLEMPDRNPQFNDELLQLLVVPEVFRSNELNQISTDNTLVFKRALLKLDATLSEKQRKKWAKEISELAEDIAALMEK